MLPTLLLSTHSLVRHSFNLSVALKIIHAKVTQMNMTKAIANLQVLRCSDSKNHVCSNLYRRKHWKSIIQPLHFSACSHLSQAILRLQLTLVITRGVHLCTSDVALNNKDDDDVTNSTSVRS